MKFLEQLMLGVQIQTTNIWMLLETVETSNLNTSSTRCYHGSWESSFTVMLSVFISTFFVCPFQLFMSQRTRREITIFLFSKNSIFQFERCNFFVLCMISTFAMILFFCLLIQLKIKIKGASSDNTIN